MEQCRFDIRKYSFSQRVINEWNKLSNDYVKGWIYIGGKIVGLSISQWLPCPLAISNLLFGMAILVNLVTKWSGDIASG